jgi:hypothetical protein
VQLFDADIDWVAVAYRLGAWPGMVLVVGTMIYTVHDEINRVASTSIRWSRQISFVAMVVLLANGLMSDASRVSLILIFWSGIVSIVINLIALRQRSRKQG